MCVAQRDTRFNSAALTNDTSYITLHSTVQKTFIRGEGPATVCHTNNSKHLFLPVFHRQPFLQSVLFRRHYLRTCRISLSSSSSSSPAVLFNFIWYDIAALFAPLHAAWLSLSPTILFHGQQMVSSSLPQTEDGVRENWWSRKDRNWST